MSTRRDFLRRLAGGFIAGPSVLEALARIEAVEPTGLMLEGFKGPGPIAHPPMTDLTALIHEIYRGSVLPHLQTLSPFGHIFADYVATDGRILTATR